MPEPWTHRFAKVNGVRLHYVEAGAGPLIVLLHGYPEFWYCWRRQVPALADAGFRVLAPDLRGYNLSSKPAGVAAYAVEHLAADIAGLIRQAGASSGRPRARIELVPPCSRPAPTPNSSRIRPAASRA